MNACSVACLWTTRNELIAYLMVIHQCRGGPNQSLPEEADDEATPMIHLLALGRVQVADEAVAVDHFSFPRVTFAVT